MFEYFAILTGFASENMGDFLQGGLYVALGCFALSAGILYFGVRRFGNDREQKDIDDEIQLISIALGDHEK